MITRYSPNDRMRTFGTLSKLIDEMLGDSTELRAGWAPNVDIKETWADITFVAELPGIKEADIDIEMVGEVLTISGKREFSEEEKKDDYVRIERNYGSFQRSFTVGMPVKADQISASYRDGVLTVRVPKGDEVKPRRIAIQSS